MGHVDSMNINDAKTQTESQLVREALVREIRDAPRWSAVIEAWHALLSVRRKADALLKEHKVNAGSPKPT